MSQLGRRDRNKDPNAPVRPEDAWFLLGFAELLLLFLQAGLNWDVQAPPAYLASRASSSRELRFGTKELKGGSQSLDTATLKQGGGENLLIFVFSNPEGWSNFLDTNSTLMLA